MVASYSSGDFQYKLVDGVIELKIEGERLPGSGKNLAREFRNQAPRANTNLIIFDIRESYHPLTKAEWAEKIERTAILFKGYILALVIRPDQMIESMEMQQAHEAKGGIIKTFSRPGDAREWVLNPDT